jgi:hypothetical protein
VFCILFRTNSDVCSIQQTNRFIYIYIYSAVLKVWRCPPTSIFHYLLLFLSPILRPLPLMSLSLSLSLSLYIYIYIYIYVCVCIPSFQVLQGRPRFFLPSGFQLIIIFGNHIRSILSTCPYQMNCSRVTSPNIVSSASIFSSNILIRFSI